MQSEYLLSVFEEKCLNNVRKCWAKRPKSGSSLRSSTSFKHRTNIFSLHADHTDLRRFSLSQDAIRMASHLWDLSVLSASSAWEITQCQHCLSNSVSTVLVTVLMSCYTMGWSMHSERTDPFTLNGLLRSLTTDWPVHSEGIRTLWNTPLVQLV